MMRKDEGMMALLPQSIIGVLILILASAFDGAEGHYCKILLTRIPARGVALILVTLVDTVRIRESMGIYHVATSAL